MDETTLVTIDGLMYVAKNELVPSMVEDQINQMFQWKELF
jgi:hypothetical protein